ncbi:MAG: gamma-glutamyltransferase [Rhodospirillales bacterium]|nr:gamma-glutamyltransferase [Rhodospirillales bacterium]
MLSTPRARNGMVTSPHHLASQAGLQVLRDGGTAIEAAVATAATLAVVYPHMTGIGGDGFWLVATPGADPVAIDACGATGAAVDPALYRGHGLTAIPQRGPLAANSVAGTVSGWDAALKISAEWQAPLPLSRILRDAIGYAEDGFAVTASQSELTSAKHKELSVVSGFADVFLTDGRAPLEGEIMRLPALGKTLRRLTEDGLDGFYRGALGRAIAAELQRSGSPISADDLAGHHAPVQPPLTAEAMGARLFNMPPPTQGLASLMILALFDRLDVKTPDGFDHIHGLVEATKQAFIVRDREVCDPAYMTSDAAGFLANDVLDALAGKIDQQAALPWPRPPSGGDTVWLGVVDGEGRSVSMIQSIFFEFGSGIVLPETGITWQNRGCSFPLTENGHNRLRPRAKPFHTLNPAMALFADGRSMVYGTMGGEGQPQTQAAIFSRYARFGAKLQEAVTAPRWLLGRTWGEASTTLKLESRIDPETVAALRRAGHDVELMPAFTSTMGHAGAIVRHPSGILEGATDPRSDGAVAAW